MMPTGRGGVRLFRFAGIDVYLHWSWFIVALIELQERRGSYGSFFWNVAEYLALFGIVLLHEFGHSLACRQVGGEADHIVLWPLGGVAYVNPPQRPGATLWSIAAGPLVNVLLLGPLTGLFVASRVLGWAGSMPNVVSLLQTVFVLNTVILVFNLLPIYPMDGGQILRSLLWFPLGKARSLGVATVLGFPGVVALLVLAAVLSSGWLAIIAVFAGVNCWQGFQHARTLAKIAAIPRRPGFACPSCGSGPPLGPYWMCPGCGNPIDTFDNQAICRACGVQLADTRCVDCGAQRPLREWVMTISATAVPPPIR